MTRMTDDQLDAAITRLLGWRAERLEGVPDAQGMAWRLAGAGFAPRPRWQQAAAGMAVVGLLVVALVGAATIASRPPAPVGPLANGPIVVANALGWHGVDAATGAASDLAPCGERCARGIDFRLSADGGSVYYIEPTRLLRDGVSSALPGSAIMRWDRLDGSVTRIVGCDSGCVMRGPVPSPDGRLLAYVESGGNVVVDARTGQEIRRLPNLFPAEQPRPFPVWDEAGRLLYFDLLSSATEWYAYRLDVRSGEQTPIELSIPQGWYWSSPDGSTTLLDSSTPGRFSLSVVDDRLEHPRLLIEDPELLTYTVAWAPDGSAFAVLVRGTATRSQNFDYELRIVDVATGVVTTKDVDDVDGQLLWLPAD